MEGNMRKKKINIGLILSVVLTLIIVVSIGGVKIANANKINTSIELGIKYLTEEEYNKAKSEFSKVLSLEDEQEEALELLMLTEQCMKLESLYNNKEYSLAAELIYEIRKNKYSSYVEKNLDEIMVVIEEKISKINKVNNIDSKINELISENKYNEAIDLINTYLGEDLKEEYLEKLNGLLESVNDARIIYEEEQKRIEEEKILEEKRKSEEERKAEEERINQDKVNNQETLNKVEDTNTSVEEVNKQIGQLDAVQLALKVVNREHPGYGPHYWERGFVSEGEPRWAFIFLKLKDPNAENIDDTEIIGKVGYTVNTKTGEVKQEEWLVQ